MNENNITIDFGGISTTLTIVFIVLKLCKIINWSWVWILSPLWITAILALIIYIIIWIYYNL